MAIFSLTVRADKDHVTAWHRGRHYGATDPAQRQATNRDTLSKRIDRKNPGRHAWLMLPGLLVYSPPVLIRREPNNDLATRMSDLTKVVSSHAASMIQACGNPAACPFSDSFEDRNRGRAVPHTFPSFPQFHIPYATSWGKGESDLMRAANRLGSSLLQSDF